jgi:hypothetical protein
VRGDDAGPEGAQVARPSSNIRRAPSARRDDRGTRRGADDRRPRDRDDRGRSRSGDDRPSRIFEPPVPQDPRSVELGAAFREAQTAMRDARKALEKRKAEYGDEPEWLAEQLAAAEARFTAAADEWAQHLETTGRKIVRAR